MERYICIHGHFYQPPRENPWLEAVELQDSAYPYHDWNERITAECYAPNAVARLLDGNGRILKLANNYARMSFNFGPTLLAWLEAHEPEVYRCILEADAESRNRFGGHGSALAQAYNHMILPLANQRDKRTQALWGIRDFERRFQRAPEGMWLPETAVDLETLDILAELGIRFTILSPYQAARWRNVGEKAWHEATGGHIDPTRAYLQNLPSGRSISLFFYDGPISRALAFEKLLSQGDHLVSRLAGAFSGQRDWPQLVHIATDGESYGHHHVHGDMALAYALQVIEERQVASLTNYGQYLENHPPRQEVEILENTAWSCAHGVERWRGDCGCNSGRPGWNQAWRGPLRESLDWLRDQAAPHYEEAAGKLLRDPWAARDQYIDVILDRSAENVDRFLARHARRELNDQEKTTVLKLLELQRHAMLMYTSCGWFFDELSGIETVQVLQYAGRAVQLGEELFGVSLETPLLERLQRAKSNLPDHGDGRAIYEKWVKPMALDWARVAAHYAVSALFETFPDEARVFCYTARRRDYQSLQAGKVRLVVGHAVFSSHVTGESAPMTFGAVHFGGHNVNCGVRAFMGEEAYAQLVKEISQAFEKADFAELVRMIDRGFGDSIYSLRSLFRDDQRRVLRRILHGDLNAAGATYRRIYEEHLPTMRFLSELGIPQPKAFQAAMDFLLNTDIRWDLEEEQADVQSIRALLQEAALQRVNLDMAGVAHKVGKRLAAAADALRSEPRQLALLKRFDDLADLACSLPGAVDKWHAQNVYFALMETQWPDTLQRFAAGEADAEPWLDVFVALGEKLGICVDHLKKKIDEAKKTPSVGALVRECFARRSTPRATYRLQFNRHFTFRQAAGVVPYLHDLGISHCYASPIFQSRQGSDHGYDVCDHSRLDPDLGTDDDFRQFTDELNRRGMGLILDVVPNHMGIGDAANTWWTDVLENGASSIYARCFDIDWEPANPVLSQKVLLPVLADQYGKILEAGEIRLAYEGGAFFVHYGGLRLPVTPRAYIPILEHQLARLAALLEPEHPHVQELRSIVTSLGHLPSRTEVSAEKVEERHREKEVIKRRLAALHDAAAEVRDTLAETVKAFNGAVGDPRSFDLLDGLLNQQAYRLAYWRVATEEINYRRFFDINELAAICTENPLVFQATHQLVLRLLAEGRACGLRIDHPDGLWNPAEYFRRLQEEYVLAWVRARLTGEQAPEDLPQRVAACFAEQRGKLSAQRGCWPLYVVAEKILCEDEPLPADWAVDGTTGYDFLALTNGLFVAQGAAEDFDRIYAGFIGYRRDFDELVQASKKMIMLVSMAGEINALSHQLDRISERNRQYRDFTLNSLTFVIREVIACLKVYRSYVTGPENVSARDRQFIEDAVARAKKLNPRTAGSIFDFVRDTVLLDNLPQFREEDRPEVVAWAMKFQQLTGPVMAKGVEDTAFYVYHRLASLCEVGGNPRRFGVSVAEFHQANQARAERWPHAMLAGSTHDTKRSEDVRARLNVLSEMPGRWQSALDRWARLNADKKTTVDGAPAPDRNDEYLLYQTLVGAWPDEPVRGESLRAFRERVAVYMEKATREAKVHTSWVNPNQAYDAAVRDFVVRLLPEAPSDPFLTDLAELVRPVAFFGRLNALAQTLLRLTCPGVPDLYQGTELWSLDLVDPDNRRPVDYDRRRAALAELKGRSAKAQRLPHVAKELLAASESGLVKLHVIHRVLAYRAERPALFERGDYTSLETSGQRGEHVCAFARRHEHHAIVVVVPRLAWGLMGGRTNWPLGNAVWKETRIALAGLEGAAAFHNVLTGETVKVGSHRKTPDLAVGAVLKSFPVALLERQA